MACQAQMLGSIDVPVDGATVSGYVQVIGFALDGNLLSNVDVFVDGTDDANRVAAAGGANINLPRPDVLQFFPQYGGTAGKNPGYQASFKASLFSNGSHTVYVRVTDVNGCSYFLTPRAIKVDNSRNQPPFGGVDFPLPDSGVSANGVLEVAGWALDDRKVDHVDVFVDGLIERQAVTGIYRADVAANYPDNTQAIVVGVRPEHRLDALRERRPHGHRQGRRRPGPAGPARHRAGCRSSTTPRTSRRSATWSSRS